MIVSHLCDKIRTRWWENVQNDFYKNLQSIVVVTVSNVCMGKIQRLPLFHSPSRVKLSIRKSQKNIFREILFIEIDRGVTATNLCLRQNQLSLLPCPPKRVKYCLQKCNNEVYFNICGVHLRFQPGKNVDPPYCVTTYIYNIYVCMC